MLGHLHVGVNMPGYLPEGDVYCAEDPDGALSALEDDLKDQQDFYWQGCEKYGTNEPTDDDHCEWCKVGAEVQKLMDLITDGTMRRDLDEHGRIGEIFTPPEGAPMHFWIVTGEGDRDDCETAKEQEG